MRGFEGFPTTSAGPTLRHMPWAFVLFVLVAVLSKRRRGDPPPSVDATAHHSQGLAAAPVDPSAPKTNNRVNWASGLLALASVLVAGASAYAAISALRTQQDQVMRHQAEQVLLLGFEPAHAPDLLFERSNDLTPEEDEKPRIQNFSRLPLSALSLHVDYNIYATRGAESPSFRVDLEYVVGTLGPCTQAVLTPLQEDEAVNIAGALPPGFDYEKATTIPIFSLRFVDTAGRAWSRRNLEPPVEDPSYRVEDEKGFYVRDERVQREPIPNCVPE